MIDPLIAPTDMIADIADAAPSQSSATTVRFAESAVATSSAGLGPTSEMGSDSDLTALKCDFRYASASGLESDITARPKGAIE